MKRKNPEDMEKKVRDHELVRKVPVFNTCWLFIPRKCQRKAELGIRRAWPTYQKYSQKSNKKKRPYQRICLSPF